MSPTVLPCSYRTSGVALSLPSLHDTNLRTEAHIQSQCTVSDMTQPVLYAAAWKHSSRNILCIWQAVGCNQFLANTAATFRHVCLSATPNHGLGVRREGSVL